MKRYLFCLLLAGCGGAPSGSETPEPTSNIQALTSEPGLKNSFCERISELREDTDNYYWEIAHYTTNLYVFGINTDPFRPNPLTRDYLRTQYDAFFQCLCREHTNQQLFLCDYPGTDKDLTDTEKCMIRKIQNVEPSSCTRYTDDGPLFDFESDESIKNYR